MSAIPEIPRPPANYESLTAVAKADWLWESLIAGTAYHPTTQPDLKMASPAAFLKVVAPRKTLAWTLDNQTDLMAADRPKIIHAQGTVALVALEIDDNSRFTGALAPAPVGGGVGLLRMSLAVPPSGKKAVTPGIGLKLLVDGAPSLDLLAMNHTVGQGRDINLFSNTFTHDLTEEHTELRPPQEFLQKFFNRVSTAPRRLTIDHLAATATDGSTAADPQRPGRLVFAPHADVLRVFRGRAHEDFRDTLALIEPGACLYDVLAVDGKDESSIGRIRLRKHFTASAGGDRLFFRHVQDPADRVPSSETD